MRHRDLLFWIWLAEQLGAGNKEFPRLISLYENPYDIFHAEEAELERIEGLSSRTVRVLADKNLEAATRILDACEQLGIGILPYGHEKYPYALRDIQDPPIVLYYKGRLPDFGRMLSIGMVGMRHMSEYGLYTAYKLSYELASAGVTVVSGMAAGIDGVCGAAALRAGGFTVAVLGCGVNVTYPKHHQNLKNEIERNGLILSEYPPGARPIGHHFPTRNRIISGLSQGTVVVEASKGSGSLITAKAAILQGRDVFAIPANVGSEGAEGTNGLLLDGANFATKTADILAPYQYIYANMLHPERLRAAEQSSRADLHYLARMGVIELTPARAPTSEPDAAPLQGEQTAEPTEKPKRTRAKREKKEKKTAEAVETAPQTEAKPKQTPDAILSSLTDAQRAVLDAIPDDRAVTADTLGALGYRYGDVIAALTMLEILGLIQKLPGALYMKT